MNTFTTTVLQNYCLAVLSRLVENKKIPFTRIHHYQDADGVFHIGADILLSIRYYALQTKLYDTANTRYNKNTSQNRWYCRLPYVYAGFDVALRVSKTNAKGRISWCVSVYCLLLTYVYIDSRQGNFQKDV